MQTKEFLNSLKGFFSIHGRMGLVSYLLWVLTIFLTSVLLVYMFEFYIDKTKLDTLGFYGIYFSATFLVILFVFISVKRTHDIDGSGWLLFSVIIIYALFFLSGSKGVNRYGLNPKMDNNFNNTNSWQFKKDYSFWFLLVLIIFFSISMLPRIQSGKYADSNRNTGIEIQKDTENNLRDIQPLPLPLTGAGKKYYTQGYSPLRIKTSTGSHYWVKVVDAYNQNVEIATYFIRGGEILNTELPVGNYYIKYAYGNTWYGEQNLFGKNTGYAKADKIFHFSYGQGYVIELIKQPDGNLNTKSIDRSQF